MSDLSIITVAVTPTLDTNVYANNDRLGSIFTIDTGREGALVEITDFLLVDSSAQTIAIDCLIFNSLPTVASADNAAIDISDAELSGKLVGSISVAAASYKATASNSYVTASNLGIFAKAVPAAPGATSKNLYGLLVVRSGTPTYAASSIKLTFKLKAY